MVDRSDKSIDSISHRATGGLDPDQTRHSVGVWYGSKLFAKVIIRLYIKCLPDFSEAVLKDFNAVGVTFPMRLSSASDRPLNAGNVKRCYRNAVFLTSSHCII